MNKLLRQLDNSILKIGVSFLIFFTAWYPKLPSVHIIHTWVYIRLEDFFIALVAIIWLIQLVRKKVKLSLPLEIPIALFWFIGLVSTISSILFIGPHLLNYFPQIAALEYIRRIEYMILFFIALSTIKSVKDVRDYLIVLSITVFGIILYGFGQQYYLFLWQAFPHFFQKFQFCFPSFQTGNEEFAKGIPLCLPNGSRITSTFGGHYDLAAYLVIIIPVLFGAFLAVKKWIYKIPLALLSLLSLVLLIFTSSRVSYIGYLIAIISFLIFYKKKIWIIPVLIVSVAVLFLFSSNTAQRFASTFRLTNVVVNTQGQLVGTTANNLPSSLKDKLAKDKIALEKQQLQGLPEGSGFIGLQTTATTNEAVTKKSLSPEEIKRLQLQNGTLQLSTVQGNFLVQKALVYDISFTTRFQSEWPNAINAFQRNPFLGSGYSSITLATDNDYLRALGETGFLGFFGFFFIFIMFGIILVQVGPKVSSTLGRAFVYSVAGGVLGLFFNASLIDVFESSKVAENLWILLGIGSGLLLLYQREKINYKEKLANVFSSHVFIVVYVFLLILTVYIASINNFFVADDFAWLKWAASSTLSDLIKNFVDAQQYFYTPLPKLITFALYTVFAFNPPGYHVFNLTLHFINSIGVYILAFLVLRKRLHASLSALLFALLPSSGENIYWFSTMATNLAIAFMLYSVIFWLLYRTKKAIGFYIMSFIFAVLSLFSYGISLILPLLILVAECFVVMRNKQKFALSKYIPFLLLIPVYGIIRIVTHAFIWGGDYSYSVPHFIANVVGNYIGYVGLLLIGEPVLPFYEGLRNGLKGSWIGVTVVILVCLIIVISLIVRYGKTIKKFYLTDSGKIVLFTKAFIVISLLLYAGLGNITERYSYLAAAGYVILLLVVLDWIVGKFVSSAKMQMITLSIVVLLISGYFITQQKIEQREWLNASNITKNLLILFRIEYEDVPSNSHFYFINVPIKYENAYVFPIGITDALWFPYRNRLPQITDTQSLDNAKAQAATHPLEKPYFFTFTNDGKVTQVTK